MGSEPAVDVECDAAAAEWQAAEADADAEPDAAAAAEDDDEWPWWCDRPQRAGFRLARKLDACVQRFRN